MTPSAQPHPSHLLYVAAGGFVGTSVRAVADMLTFSGAIIPFSTLAANVLGCLALGWLAGRPAQPRRISGHIRLFLAVGLLGSLTTYSTYAADTLALLVDGAAVAAAWNVAAHLGLGGVAVWAGTKAARFPSSVARPPGSVGFEPTDSRPGRPA